jgi:hypothetical protein
MSGNDNGLYDFIKGKSLFSPTNRANRKRSRSRSRGPREGDRTSTLPPPELSDSKNNPLFHRTISTTNEQPQRNYSPIDIARQQQFAPTQQPYHPPQHNYNPPQQPTFPSPQTTYAPLQNTFNPTPTPTPYTPAQRFGQES